MLLGFVSIPKHTNLGSVNHAHHQPLEIGISIQWSKTGTWEYSTKPWLIIVGYGQPCMHVFFEETRSWNYIYDIYSSWKTTHWVDRVICLNMIYIRLIFFHASGALYWLILLSENCLAKIFIHALLFPLH